ncbi:MAG TPA: PKD-like domain-containing protein [Bacteroidales bacterium]|nr:PKD-like domain-containing protein [Bacteroidales bacterium]
MASGLNYSSVSHYSKYIYRFHPERLVFLVFLLFACLNSGIGQTNSVTFTSGTGSWMVPAGVTDVIIECWGAGGGGSNRGGAAGGGGGGAYSRGTLTGLTPGSLLNYTVGAGGTVGNGGGNSSVGTIVANGGGSVNNSRTGGTGGAASPLSGSVTASYAGGNGGTAPSNGGGNNENGGGGGGSAFTNANGNNGTGGQNNPNATSPGGTGSGNGGDGAASDGNPDATAGTGPGGGGGGRGEGASTSKAGANGQVRITWTPVYKALFTAMDFGSSTWYAGETRTVTVTVINNGLAPWSDTDPDINIGVKWNSDADYLVRVDAGNLAIGSSNTYSLTITAPTTGGTENLTFDAVCEGYCWFSDNTSSCGLGNTKYTSGNITILPSTYQFTTSGTFTALPGITSVKVQAWGGGGGGSTITSNSRRGGGGGGGAFASSILTVVPGNTYNVVVGSGGAANTAGGSSIFDDTRVIAVGGSGGTSNSATAGQGGTAAASTGSTKYSGGNGADGQTSYSGGGGGGAGTTGAGGSAPAADANNGAAGIGRALNGGNGGTGRNTNGDGNPGITYGGGGSGSRRGNSGTVTGGSGADGYVIVSLPSAVTLSSPSQIGNDTVFQGDLKQPVFSFATAIASSEALLTKVDFTTAGTYAATDLGRFQLWYSATNNFTSAVQIGADISSTLGTGSHSFTGLNQTVATGTTGYFWVTADISNTAVSGRTIIVNAITPSDLTYELANVSGSTTSGGTQLIQPTANITLSSSNPAVPVASATQGTFDQQVYAFTTAVTNANAVLTSLSFVTTGSCSGSDLVRFKLWYNSSNNFASAFNIGSGIISGLGSGTHTFSDLSQLINSGTTGYFWITVDIASFPTNNNTLTVSALTTANLTFERAIKSGTAYAGGQMTISATSGIMLGSTRPAVSANSVLQGSVKQPVYKFTTLVTGSNVTVTSVTFTTSGTYIASDMVNFKLWYSLSNSLVSATQIGGTITTGLGSGSHTFNFSQTITAPATGYFWITADIAAGAVSPHTLVVNAITMSDIATNGTESGTAYAGGTQTIQNNVDTDGNGVADIYDWDDDDDGIPDVTENAPCNVTAIELFPNNDFSAGNTGFSSAYGYAAPAGDHTLWPEGLYTIVTNPQSIHASFSTCGDHTSGTGNMMVINADPTAGKIVWSSGAIAVTPNTDYTLSFYVTTVCMPNPAQLIWNVNGENIGSQFNATTTTCQWVNAVAIWNSGNKTTATFDIINLNIVASGNDFALDDISCKYRINCDTDGDGVQDRFDLDSDNDGIYDVYEAGGTDANRDGIIDSYATDADHDGLADAVDNQDAGNGASEVKNGTPLLNPDTDVDGLPNIIDRESDNDGCYDTYEAGFNDDNNDGILGTAPVTVDSEGKVTSAAGYTTPADGNGDGIRDFMQKIPEITVQPSNSNICAPSTGTTFSVTATGSPNYQWQFNDGTGWSNVNNGGIYSGATTANLVISSAVTIANNGYQYRVQLTSLAYRCTPVTSNAVTLGVFTGAPASPGAITGNTTVCPSIISVYSITPVAQALSYNWSVPAGWSIISGGNSTTVTVMTGAAGSGNVSVSATNTCGTSGSSSLGVSIASPTPTFTAIPANPSCQGSNLTYTTQTGKTSYAWTFSGTQFVDYTIISGGGSSDNTVTLRWLTTGSKTVTVNYTSGGCQGATAASNTTTINPNVIIMTHPVTPVNMCAGTGSATFSVTTSGTVSTYQWQVYNGSSWNNLSNGAPYSNVTTADMTISSPTMLINNYQYRCQVTGTCGTATSNPATLIVNTSAITAQSTAGQTQCIGGAFSSISITCPGSGLTYQWYSNTSASTTGGTSLGSANGAQTDTYTPQTTVAGTLYYYCIVTGVCGTTTSTISGAFTVNSAPSITTQPSSPAAVCSGTNSSTFTVAASGTGLTYQWQRGISGVYTSITAGTTPNDGCTYSGFATATLTVTNAVSAMNGYTYRCVVSGTCNPAATTDGAASLTVNTAPSITTQPSSPAAVCSGTNSSTFTVAASGTGLTYQWQRGISGVYTSITAGTTPNDGCTYSGFATATLTVTNAVSAMNGYTYRCMVSGTCNPVATSDGAATLTVNTIPSVSNKTASAYSGVAFTVTPVNGTDVVPAGTTYSWPLPVVTGGLTGGATGTGAASISGTLHNPLNSAQTATYTITPTAAGCTGSDFTVTVTINAIPVISNMTATVCSGTGFSVTPTDGINGIVPPGTTYSWNAPTVTGGLTGGATGSGAANITGTLSNPTNNVQTATYTVTPLTGTYTGNTFTVTVTVNPVPSFSISSETTVCEGTAITLEAGAGFAAYEWKSGATILGTSHSLDITTGTVDTSTPVTESYSVKVTNTYGCESTDTQDISVYHKSDTGPEYLIPNSIHE